MRRNEKQIPLFKVHMPAGAAEKVKKVLFSGYVNEGIQVTEFEKKLRSYTGNPMTMALNSCTSAITLALKISGVRPGSEVISTPMTCVATNTPISNLFAKPVWCDIDPQTGNIDAGLIERKITKKTKAILFVDWVGIPADLDAIMAVAKRHNIKVVEDAAQAFGAVYRGRNVGTVCDFTCFSFQAIKHINTGDGGALSFLDGEDFSRAKKLKWFGIDREATKDSAGNWRGSRWDCVIPEAGFKFHMNNIEAAIGLEQMKYARRILENHRKNAAFYIDKLKHVSGISLPRIDEDTLPAWWVFMLFAEKRDDLSKKLAEHGISSSLLHVRNDVYRCFEDSKADLPHVARFQDSELCIPCGWWVSREDAERIVSVIKGGW